jgi:hypothetical protein
VVHGHDTLLLMRALTDTMFFYTAAAFFCTTNSCQQARQLLLSKPALVKVSTLYLLFTVTDRCVHCADHTNYTLLVPTLVAALCTSLGPYFSYTCTTCSQDSAAFLLRYCVHFAVVTAALCAQTFLMVYCAICTYVTYKRR